MSAALPFPLPETAFWQAVEEGRLTFQRCTACGHAWLPERQACPNCWSLEATRGPAPQGAGPTAPAPPLGRELEIARLLTAIKEVRNVVWLTADVHYTAAHFYDPQQARHQDFRPFWEFVSGPLNAGTFGPGELDDTFGPQLKFFKAPPEGQANLPPSAGLQFFGQVDIEGASGRMTVTLKDLENASLYTVELTPEA